MVPLSVLRFLFYLGFYIYVSIQPNRNIYGVSCYQKYNTIYICGGSVVYVAECTTDAPGGLFR